MTLYSCSCAYNRQMIFITLDISKKKKKAVRLTGGCFVIFHRKFNEITPLRPPHQPIQFTSLEHFSIRCLLWLFYYSLCSLFICLIDTWDVSQISWEGYIHSSKISLLPKILNPFRVPPHVLRILQRSILNFIWGRTRPRLNRPLLHTP